MMQFSGEEGTSMRWAGGDVVGKRKTVPLNHAWIESARSVHTCLGD